MSSPKKRLGLIVFCIFITSFSAGWIIRGFSEGGTPTVDPTPGKGLSDFSWYNASVGISSPYYEHDVLGNYTAWIEGLEGGGVSDHGALTGLGDDDHSLYLLQSGAEGLTGDWDIGNYNLTGEYLWADEFYKTGIGNYTAWIEGLEGGGGVGNFTGATAYVGFDADFAYQDNYFLCDGVADDVQINAAIASLPVGGGRVVLLEGTFNIEATIVPISNMMLEGQGYGTLIYQVNGANLGRMIGLNMARDYVTIENLRVDGNKANNPTAEHGIQFALATDCLVKNCWIYDCTETGIKLSKNGVQAVNNFVSGCGYFGIEASQVLSDYYVIIVNNVVTGNGHGGIYADGGVVMGNLAYNNGATSPHGGIYIAHAAVPTSIIGNTAIGNYKEGIMVGGHSTIEAQVIISGNVIVRNQRNGIYADEEATNGMVITDNICAENGQEEAGIYSGIYIVNGASYNIITENSCYDNQETPTQGYGIMIGEDCVGNIVKDNVLRGNTVSPFKDWGTDTILATKTFQFITSFGGDAAWKTTSPTGIQIDATGETALAVGEAPLEVQMVVRFRVKGVVLGATGSGKGMLLEIIINAGKPNGSEAYNAEAISVAGVISTEDDIAVNDAVEWIIDATDDGDIDDINFGETIEMFAIFEDTGANGDIATNVVIRSISIDFV